MAVVPTVLVSLGDDPDIRLDRPILLIGRSPDCDVVIDSAKISRRHCCIAQVGDYLVVRDLASTNGVLVNTKRVEECKLRIGDELTIGNSAFRVDRGNNPKSRDLNPGAGQPRPVSDSILERADVPIALPETDLGPDDNKTTESRAAAIARLRRTDVDPRLEDDGPRLHIPDDIKLLPLSDPELHSKHSQD